jgi:hypothetical protein
MHAAVMVDQEADAQNAVVMGSTLTGTLIDQQLFDRLRVWLRVVK